MRYRGFESRPLRHFFPIINDRGFEHPQGEISRPLRSFLVIARETTAQGPVGKQSYLLKLLIIYSHLCLHREFEYLPLRLTSPLVVKQKTWSMPGP